MQSSARRPLRADRSASRPGLARTARPGYPRSSHRQPTARGPGPRPATQLVTGSVFSLQESSADRCLRADLRPQLDVHREEASILTVVNAGVVDAWRSSYILPSGRSSHARESDSISWLRDDQRSSPSSSAQSVRRRQPAGRRACSYELDSRVQDPVLPTSSSSSACPSRPAEFQRCGASCSKVARCCRLQQPALPGPSLLTQRLAIRQVQ